MNIRTELDYVTEVMEIRSSILELDVCVASNRAGLRGGPAGHVPGTPTL